MHRVLLLIVMALTLNACAAYTATSGRVVLQDDSKPADARFSSSDRATITQYYKKFPAQKSAAESTQLIKGDVLPAKAPTESLPAELEKKLSYLPYTHVRLRVGSQVVMIEKKTRIIVDVLYGIGR
ncbi:MAG: hypothetical protein HY081_01675 [Gammaproteobacteria bacterium]|nr:hypothetical protein [Gammaproteobacteria bacterium]